MLDKLEQTVLVIVDVQMAFVQRDQRGDRRSTPQAEANIARLLTFFRQYNATIVHVHHHSLSPDSLFRAELPGSRVQEFVAPLAHEAVYIKHANSAFIGTTLEQDLRQAGLDHVVLCGATANHCVETTTRMAGNLNFNTYYVSDAVWAYDATGPDNRMHRAEDIQSMSMCNLHGEFATVIDTDSILANLQYSAGLTKAK